MTAPSKRRKSAARKPTAQSKPAAQSATPADAPAAELTPFELSRVYAKGWLAGMNAELPTAAPAIHHHAESLNPYQRPPERSRWMDGFTQAVQRKYGVDVSENPAGANTAT